MIIQKVKKFNLILFIKQNINENKKPIKLKSIIIQNICIYINDNNTNISIDKYTIFSKLGILSIVEINKNVFYIIIQNKK